jgi:hypothetical protein
MFGFWVFQNALELDHFRRKEISFKIFSLLSLDYINGPEDRSQITQEGLTKALCKNPINDKKSRPQLGPKIVQQADGRSKRPPARQVC